MVWLMSMTDTWQPKRPGPASDRDNVTRQTLRAGIRGCLSAREHGMV